MNTCSAPQFEVLEARLLMAANAYTVIDLGSLGGGDSFATDLNSAAQVVGRSVTGTQPVSMRAFTWLAATGMQELNLLDGFAHGEATALNDAGHVAATVKDASLVERAVLAVPDLPAIDLGTLGGAWSWATNINNSDAVVGASQIGGGESIFHAFVWQGGVITDLGTLGGSRSAAAAINDAGRVVGWSLNAADAVRAFAWQSGVLTDLGTLGGPGAAARAINDAGHVVGDADTGRHDANGFQTFHAAMWDGASTIDLGTLGGRLSSAGDININGDVVGWAQIKGRSATRRAFVWSNGSMVDLNDLIGHDSPWILEQATAINDAGQIVAFGRAATDTGTTRAFLVEPLFADLVTEWAPRRPSQTLIPGDKFTATVRVANRGPGPSLGRTSVEIFLSQDATLDTAIDRLVHLSDNVSVNLEPGAQRTHGVKLTLPGDVVPGDYQFLVRVDGPDLIDEGGQDQNVSAAATVHQVVWQFGRLPTRSGAKLTLDQPDHDDPSRTTKVTYRLNGAGIGEVTRHGDDFDVYLSDTNHHSSAKIKVAQRHSRAQVRHIDVNESINKLIGQRTVLRGNATIGGSLGELHMDDAVGGNSVVIGTGGRRRESAQLTFGHVEDLTVDSALRIRSIETLDWIHKDGPAPVIVAPAVNKVQITGHRGRRLDGDFAAGFVVGDGPGSKALGDVTVAGAITGGWWDVRGGMNSLHAGEIHYHNDIANPIWGAMVDGDIDSLTVTGSVGGRVTAWSIDSLTVGQDLAYALIQLTRAAAPPGSAPPVLKRMNVGRWMDHVSLVSRADLGAIRTAAMRHTTIRAGVRDAVTDLPATAGDFDALASIEAVHVYGHKDLRPVVVDSEFAAWQIGSISARYAATEAGEIPLRAAAHEIRSLFYRDEGELLRLRRPADFPARIDSPSVLVRLV